jgi:hypothetical protein
MEHNVRSWKLPVVTGTTVVAARRHRGSSRKPGRWRVGEAGGCKTARQQLTQSMLTPSRQREHATSTPVKVVASSYACGTSFRQRPSLTRSSSQAMHAGATEQARGVQARPSPRAMHVEYGHAGAAARTRGVQAGRSRRLELCMRSIIMAWRRELTASRAPGRPWSSSQAIHAVRAPPSSTQRRRPPAGMASAGACSIARGQPPPECAPPLLPTTSAAYSSPRHPPRPRVRRFDSINGVNRVNHANHLNQPV